MATIDDLQTIMANAQSERAKGLGKQVDILNPDETVKNAALYAIVRGPSQNEIERLSGALQIDTDVVFEVGKQGSFTLSGIEPHLVKVRYPITDGLIHEIVHVETDDVDPDGIGTVVTLFGKTPARGIGEMP